MFEKETLASAAARYSSENILLQAEITELKKFDVKQIIQEHIRDLNEGKSSEKLIELLNAITPPDAQDDMANFMEAYSKMINDKIDAIMAQAEQAEEAL
jgi:hypothetical protein